MRTRIQILLGGGLLALVLAACSNGPSGSAYGGGNGAAGGQGTQGGSTAVTEVKVTTGSLGRMLVDAHGRTLYVFSSDANGASSCYGDCATNWPALTTKGSPKAGAGLMDGALGTMTRTDGSTQVTVDGHPVYTFSGDTAPGDTNGEGFGGLWFVASPTGTPLKAGGTANGSTGGNGNGGGSSHYGY
jgi:predicted lipoprotein with Yx(FWY)xxD motif